MVKKAQEMELSLLTIVTKYENTLRKTLRRRVQE